MIFNLNEPFCSEITSEPICHILIWSYRLTPFSLVQATGVAGSLTNQRAIFDNCRLGPDRAGRQAEQLRSRLYINVKVRSWV